VNAARLVAVLVAAGVITGGGLAAYEHYKPAPKSQADRKKIDEEIEFLHKKILDRIASVELKLTAAEAWLMQTIVSHDYKADRDKVLKQIRELYNKVYEVVT
jgi:hypothetical protein